jgi:uncharacterized protein with ParB-like and HNH nuclease domain
MPELSVSRKNISKLLTDMQNKKFVIPDYQRPYKWDEEKCDILWEDITNFHETKGINDEYFLGTVVTFKNENNIDIIDGQQRITSFFLLLRAFYKKLEEMPEDIRVLGLKNQIAPCIWDIDPISQQVEDRKKIHIETMVATDDDKDKFHSLLEKGTVEVLPTNIYSRNYNFFYNKCQQYARNNPMQWQPLCVTILQKCIVLPIECDVQDTALTIFSTLNDRGMPLSDSDIFKAQIYKNKPNETEKNFFTEKWIELTSICKSAHVSLDDIFRYYTHIIRAQNNDRSKEVGLRKFYYTGATQYEKLKAPKLMDDLFELASFWLYINTGTKNDYISVEFDFGIQKYLQILSKYPNEYWKYITNVFYLKNKNKEKNDYNKSFVVFLKQLISFLFSKFIEKPTVNAIKDDIYQGCIFVEQTGKLNFTVTQTKEELTRFIPGHSSSKMSRGLLLLFAYLNEKQKELINNFETEHIFPKKWQTANYNDWNEVEAKEYLEKFGNKVAIEKKINIIAGNKYFGRKKIQYLGSKIEVVRELANYHNDDWNKEDITQREEIFLTVITDFLTTE